MNATLLLVSTPTTISHLTGTMYKCRTLNRILRVCTCGLLHIYRLFWIPNPPFTRVSIIYYTHKHTHPQPPGLSTANGHIYSRVMRAWLNESAEQDLLTPDYTLQDATCTCTCTGDVKAQPLVKIWGKTRLTLSVHKIILKTKNKSS